jgi:hypothetical protein
LGETRIRKKEIDQIFDNIKIKKPSCGGTDGSNK